jgi:hypothetical protein
VLCHSALSHDAEVCCCCTCHAVLPPVLPHDATGPTALAHRNHTPAAALPLHCLCFAPCRPLQVAAQIARHSAPAVAKAKECIAVAQEAALGEGLRFEKREVSPPAGWRVLKEHEPRMPCCCRSTRRCS